MKSKKFSKKLTLNKKTVADLEMKKVKGGAPLSIMPYDCPYSFPVGGTSQCPWICCP